MECMQAKALRPSLRGELTQNELAEEIYYNTATHTAVSCVSGEDSLVDEFLDLQNVDLLFEDKQENDDDDEEEEEEEEEEEDEKSSFSFDRDTSNLSRAFSDSQLATQLALHLDEIEGLEWVSHFVDDSNSEFSLYSSENNQVIRPPSRAEPEPNRPGFASGATPFPSVPVKPRTKRSRPPVATRPSPLSPLSESSSASSSSSSASSSPPPSFFGFSPGLLFAGPVRAAKTGVEPGRKKQRRKAATSGDQGGPQFQRRCSHCQVQKTPQWRTGPLGAKTLCNACGVRFKSGRLFPEYRPACSPTFSSSVHSNSHRKVLEMRKKKEPIGLGPGSGLTQVISTF